MVGLWENRLQLRRIEWLALGLAVGAGLIIPKGSLTGEAGRLLVTFFGLISASILPTITLILGCMVASGQSVQTINELKLELSKAMDALFLLFGLVVIAVLSLLSLAIPIPTLFRTIPLINEILPRSGQALIVASFSLIVTRVGQIPAILRRVLDIRHRIAADEARRKTHESAAKAGDVKTSFPTHPDFGKSVALSDIKDAEPH